MSASRVVVSASFFTPTTSGFAVAAISGPVVASSETFEATSCLMFLIGEVSSSVKEKAVVVSSVSIFSSSASGSASASVAIIMSESVIS